MTSYDRIAIAAPRGHAKSTWHSLVYPLWNILFGKKKFIVLISDSIQQSSDLLGAIAEELETNETLIRDFGKIAGYIPPDREEKKKWSTKELITITGIKVVAKSWNSRIRGIKHNEQRPDLIIADDIENDDNVQNVEMREKLARIFSRSVMQIGSLDVQIIIIGTILHFDSFLANIIDSKPDKWFTKKYKAIKDDGSILWPEWWSMEKFDEIRNDPTIGELGFQSEYMNNPIDPDAQIIKPNVFYDSVDHAELHMFGYIDLAISEKETADYTAVVTIGKHKQTGKLYVIDAVKMRGDVTKQIELVTRLHTTHNYLSFGVESVAYQKAFQQILVTESNRLGTYIPAIAVEIDKDKKRRAQTIVPYVENGTILFNRNLKEFLTELMEFPKGAHDDLVDAFIGAVKLALNSSGSAKIRAGSERSYPTNY